MPQPNLVCKCCGKWSRDVKRRVVGSSPIPLCQACWDDPTQKYDDCEHGQKRQP